MWPTHAQVMFLLEHFSAHSPFHTHSHISDSGPAVQDSCLLLWAALVLFHWRVAGLENLQSLGKNVNSLTSWRVVAGRLLSEIGCNEGAAPKNCLWLLWSPAVCMEDADLSGNTHHLLEKELHKPKMEIVHLKKKIFITKEWSQPQPQRSQYKTILLLGLSLNLSKENWWYLMTCQLCNINMLKWTIVH